LLHADFAVGERNQSAIDPQSRIPTSAINPQSAARNPQ